MGILVMMCSDVLGDHHLLVIGVGMGGVSSLNNGLVFDEGRRK